MNTKFLNMLFLLIFVVLVGCGSSSSNTIHTPDQEFFELLESTPLADDMTSRK